MSLLEIAIWTVCWAFLLIRIAMLVAFVVLPMMIVRTLYHQSEA